MAYTISRFLVNRQSAMRLKLSAGGGAAISITPAVKEDENKYKFYK